MIYICIYIDFKENGVLVKKTNVYNINNYYIIYSLEMSLKKNGGWIVTKIILIVMAYIDKVK
jgi:hypothetical protein